MSKIDVKCSHRKKKLKKYGKKQHWKKRQTADENKMTKLKICVFSQTL